LLALAACSPVQGGEGGGGSEAPGEVIPAAGPGDVATVVLAAATEERLGLEVAPLERRSVPRARTFGADVVLPPGRRIPVSAPFAGALEAPAGAEPLIAGARVEAGQPLFELMPLLTPEREVLTPSEKVQAAKARSDMQVAISRARGDLAGATARLEAAHLAFDRAQTLVDQEAGSLRARDEARAELGMAQAIYDAAEQAIAGLESIARDDQVGERRAFSVVAPLTGTLVALQGSPGRVVAPGEPLFEVADLTRLWVRVPVYVGDLERIDTAREALVGDLSGRPGGTRRVARPVAAPPSANPRASAVDLWYELADESASGLRPGQRVGATLALNGEEEVLVAPWSAVLVDVNGGEWVFARVADHTYARRRVRVERVSGDLAVLAGGPEPGTPVVTTGAAELYGTELDGVD
jgi:hypothetical protein